MEPDHQERYASSTITKAALLREEAAQARNRAEQMRRDDTARRERMRAMSRCNDEH